MNYQQQGPQGQWPAQQPQQWPGQAPVSTGSPVTAVIAALLGLIGAGGLVGAAIHFSTEIDLDFGDMPTGAVVMVVARLVIGLLMLLGAILLAARKTAGAVLLIIGSVLGLASVLLEPVVNEIYDYLGIGVGDFLELIFEFHGIQQVLLAIGLIASPLALIFTLTTFGWLSGGKAQQQFPPQYPQQPQAPQSW